jgi:hypothetical protein
VTSSNFIDPGLFDGGCNDFSCGSIGNLSWMSGAKATVAGKRFAARRKPCQALHLMRCTPPGSHACSTHWSEQKIMRHDVHLTPVSSSLFLLQFQHKQHVAMESETFFQ